MLSIKITFQELPTRYQKTKRKAGKKKSECLSSVPRQIHRLQDAELSLIKEEIKRIVHDNPSVAMDRAIMQAIKQCKVPVCVPAIKKRVDLTGIPFVKQKKMPFTVSDQLLKEGIALVAGGASFDIASLAIEVSHCELRGKRAKVLLTELTDDDIKAAKEKYRDVLELFGIYNRMHMRYDMDELKSCVDASCKNRYHTDGGSGFRYKPELIAKFVELYNDAAGIGLHGWARIRYVKTASHTALNPETISKLIFSHSKYPGCEDIPTPEHKAVKPRPLTKQTRLRVMEVRYLRDYKNLSRTAVSKVTKFKTQFIDQAYHNRWFVHIVLTQDVKQQLDEKYKDLDIVKRGHAGVLCGNQYELRLAQEIIYLRDVMGYNIDKVNEVLDLNPLFTKNVYNGELHADLQVPSDVAESFLQRYSLV